MDSTYRYPWHCQKCVQKFSSTLKFLLTLSPPLSFWPCSHEIRMEMLSCLLCNGRWELWFPVWRNRFYRVVLERRPTARRRWNIDEERQQKSSKPHFQLFLLKSFLMICQLKRPNLIILVYLNFFLIYFQLRLFKRNCT